MSYVPHPSHSSRFYHPTQYWVRNTDGGGGLESRCVGRVYGADDAVHGIIRTVHTT